MNLEEESLRGSQALQIIDSELWKEAMSSINNDLLTKMAAHHADAEACQIIALTKFIVDKFQQYFEEIRDTGRLADIQINRE